MQQKRERVVRLKNLPDRPLTESEIVDATVAFANGARLEIEGLESDNPTLGSLVPSGKIGDKRIEAMLGFLRDMHEAKSDEGERLWPKVARPSTTDVTEYRAQVREATRSILASIVAYPTDQARALAVTGIDQVIRPCAVLRAPPAPLLTYRYAFADDLDLVLLGRILLADQSRQFQARLCQCLYSQCGNFFFEMKAAVSRRGGGGMRRRKYCCDEHMNRARDERRTERAQAKRRAPRRPK